MDQAKKLPKILLYRQANADSQSENAWSHLQKALKSFSELTELNAPPNFEQVQTDTTQYDHIFLDIELTNKDFLLKDAIPKVSFVSNNTFEIDFSSSDSTKIVLAKKYPILILEEVALPDLVRLLFCSIFVKRHSGVAPFMDKGSIILGEKVQSLDSIGILADRIALYLNELDGFTLKNRIFDFRQIILGLLAEAYQQVKKSSAIAPTVDFQMSASANKIALNLRFPKGELQLSQLPILTIFGRDLQWQILWQNSDFLIVTLHKQTNEIEISSIITNPTREKKNIYRTLLWNEQENSIKKENYTIVPDDFHFKVISELKARDLGSTVVKETAILQSDEFSLDDLTPELKEKFIKLEQEKNFIKDKLQKEEVHAREFRAQILKLEQELAQRKAELTREKKTAEVQGAKLKQQFTELEEKLAKASAPAVSTSAADAQSIAKLNENITKLEASLRVAEGEKTNLTEKFTSEQKRTALVEQKYATLMKEQTAKDKEIQDLKALILKNKREQTVGNSVSVGATNSAAGNIAQKLKETEAREITLKQEAKKHQLKIDTLEKNIKAVQTEFTEKNKLLEQKLQEAKTKEVELLKKVEELSSALKKASKAA